MIREFLTLRGIDQCLILFFICFAVAIVAGLFITSREELERAARRMITGWIMKREAWQAAVLRDDEPFDSSWMKYREWEETRL